MLLPGWWKPAMSIAMPWWYKTPAFRYKGMGAPRHDIIVARSSRSRGKTTMLFSVSPSFSRGDLALLNIERKYRYFACKRAIAYAPWYRRSRQRALTQEKGYRHEDCCQRLTHFGHDGIYTRPSPSHVRMLMVMISRLPLERYNFHCYALKQCDGFLCE